MSSGLYGPILLTKIILHHVQTIDKNIHLNIHEFNIVLVIKNDKM